MSDTLDFLDELEKDAEETALPTNEAIKQIGVLVQELREHQKELDDLAEQQKELNAKVRDLEEVKIPAIFMEAGLSSIETEDGAKVSIKEETYAAINKANQEEAFQWLRDNEYGDLIKNKVEANFGRGEDELAAALLAFAKEQHIDVAQKTSVHAGTLKATVKEDGWVGRFSTDILKLFGIYVQKRAVVKG